MADASIGGNNGDEKTFNPVLSVILATYMFLVGAALVYMLIVFWRAVPDPDETVAVVTSAELDEAGGDLAMAAEDAAMLTTPAEAQEVFIFGGHWTPGPDVVLLLLVIIGGALGALAYAIRGFSRHHGLQDYDDSWNWWYVFKMPVGSILALGVYFILRGGLVSVNTEASEINAYGVVGLAFIVGFATKEIAEWIHAIASRIFATDPIEEDEDDDDGGGIANATEQAEAARERADAAAALAAEQQAEAARLRQLADEAKAALNAQPADSALKAAFDQADAAASAAEEAQASADADAARLEDEAKGLEEKAAGAASAAAAPE